MILATKAAIATSGKGPLPYLWLAVDSLNIYTSTSTDLSGSFTAQSSPLSQSMIDGASSGFEFVIAGYSGQMAYSDDGTTWTLVTSSFSTSNINDVAWADGTWVAVGAGGKIATSDDGITWTQQTSGTANDINCVAYGAGTWVALYNGGGRYSTDGGVTWSATGSTTLSTAPETIYYWPDKSRWLAAGDTGTTGALAYSDDGITWSASSSPTTLGGVFDYLSNSTTAVAVIYNSSVQGDIITSTNGSSWSNQNPGYTTLAPVGAQDNTDLFATWPASSIYTSTNGATWTNQGSKGFGADVFVHSTPLPASR